MPMMTMRQLCASAHDLLRARMVACALALEEFLGLLHRAPEHKDQRNDETADEERNAPAPCRHLVRRNDGAEPDSKQRHEDDGDLLAAGLPADVEALVAWGRDLGQINRDAAELDAGRESLDQPAHDDNRRRQPAERLVTGNEGNG
jgi:hypothetical protein